nr:MAG TPA: hypothetical protein [Caudoviricetes sp.]
MLRFRGFKRHTTCQTYERFYFHLVCFRFILLPNEQLHILFYGNFSRRRGGLHN